jgi:tetratricopeptide (TPR) repeat protein
MKRDAFFSLPLALLAAQVFCAASSMAQSTPPAVRTYEGTLTIPTYEHTGRETQPPLFGNSTVSGMYPFTTYIMPFKPDGPKPRTYRAIFLENEYLKVTYVPEFGGRIFSVYDKLRGREVFYRNDVIKPAPYNPRDSWQQSGLELTGPHDLHMLTLYGEPFWSNKVVPHDDGSVSLTVAEIDPVYHMKVNLTATLHPGVAALQMSVFCYNGREGRMPQMFWISSALNATEKTRYIYPMSRTIGHTTSEIADWPVYNGIDYSLDRNNKHMLGVFGIDIYGDFQGAYQFDRDYGVFRYADRRVVQGMKMWTFGYSAGSTVLEHGYTDKAGPYVEVQSGRHVWDGHYEWVGPHKVENWSEWWVPVAGLGGLTTITRDVALNLEAAKGSVQVRLVATRALPGANVVVTAGGKELLNTRADLSPSKPFSATAPAAETKALAVRVTDNAGHELMNYLRPDTDPGRKEYTPFTRPLEKPQKSPDQMGIEELVLAAEFKIKELKFSSATDLLNKALERDPGFSRAHLLFGIYHFNAGRYDTAVKHLEKAIERDPYLDDAYYYLAMSQFALGDEKRAERNLYYIWPQSAYYGVREYHLGRLAFLKKDFDGAAGHLDRAIVANGWDLSARHLLALTRREQGDTGRALEQLAEIQRIDPADRPALAERFFLNGDAAAKAELLRLLGGQSQEALDLSIVYQKLQKWNEAAEVLKMVEQNNKDPWGTPSEFYYMLAHCLKHKGEAAQVPEYLKKARAAGGNVDRFPYREESEAPLREAIEADPKDAVARFDLACLLYYRERPADAIRQFEAAVQANPGEFSYHRALGLAYAEQSYPIEKAGAELDRAVKINPAHVRTLNDLSTLYAKAGKFDEQLAVLKQGLARSPKDDDLAEGILTANLMKGRYDEAEKLIATHEFAPRHRSYGLRDEYRLMRYGMGAAAFNGGKYAEALTLFESAMKPPVSLGVDTFEFQSTPRKQYYVGRTLEALGRLPEAKAAYQKGIEGMEQLSGDRDSWSSDNFHMVLSLDKLGRKQDADALSKHFEEFAKTELDSNMPHHRAEARYLLGLVNKREGRQTEARKLMGEAVEAEPNFLPPRYELRGDALDALPGSTNN